MKFSWVMSIIDLCLQCSLLYGDLSVRISVQELRFRAKCCKSSNSNRLFNVSHQNTRLSAFTFEIKKQKKQKQMIHGLTGS